MMQSRSNDPSWDFLGEYLLDEWMSGNEAGGMPTSGTLFQAIRDLDIPGECLKRIETTLIELVQLARARNGHDKSGCPVTIRLFYGKKATQPGSSAQAAGDSQAKQASGSAQAVHPAYAKIIGGWGFFIIERARDFPASSTAGSPNCIDLYLYREGE